MALPVATPRTCLSSQCPAPMTGMKAPEVLEHTEAGHARRPAHVFGHRSELPGPKNVTPTPQCHAATETPAR